MRLVGLVLIGLAAMVTADVPKIPITELRIDIEHQVPEEQCTLKSHDGDKLSMHYTGTLYDTGAKFDSSLDRGRPFQFTLGAGQVIQGWDQGLKSMCIGEKRRLFIPSSMGYGDRGFAGVIPGRATLVFDVELMDIKSERRMFDNTGKPTDQSVPIDRYAQIRSPSVWVFGGVVVSLALVGFMYSRQQAAHKATD
ncbi:FK506-binding protein 2B [Chlamydoabsidia padenii]|nr:FK506-binding protein 2B [Chlamydoabsidia padenii]